MKIASQISMLAIMFASSLVEAKTDIILKFPDAEYNSITGNYTRNYCGAINSKVSTNLGLDRKEIHALIKSLRTAISEWAEIVNDSKTTNEIVKFCENQKPPIAITYVDGYKKGSFKMVNCTDSSTYAKTVRELILESNKVLVLKPSSCKSK
jgi:hypothetical protein